MSASTEQAPLTPPIAVKPPSPSPNRYKRLTAGTVSANGLLIVLGAAFLVPLLWLVFASFDKTATASLRLPNLSLIHYKHELTGTNLKPFWNSFYIAAVSTIVTTVVALFAGYALSRRHIPFKRTFMLVVLFMSGLPVTILLVPIYQFLTANGQVNFGDLAAYSILFAIPVIAIYLLVSRKLSGAFTFAGGIKT